MSSSDVAMRWNLQIEPWALERDFWRSTQTLRALKLADTIASVISLLHVVTAVIKFAQLRFFSATAPFLYAYIASNLVYAATVALPLFLMTFRAATYHAHRLRIIAACRVLLVVVSIVVLNSNTTVTAISRALAARTTAEQPRPLIALLLNTLHPGVFIVQQAMYPVPFRWTVLLQLANFVASLLWTSRLPCELPPYLQSAGSGTAVGGAPAIANPETVICSTAAAAEGTSITANQIDLFFQGEATDMCLLFHYLTELLNTLFGIPHVAGATSPKPAPEFQQAAAAPVYCQGVYAIQTLQLFVSMLMLLVAPMCIVFWWECTWKQYYLATITADDPSNQVVDSFWTRLLEWFNSDGANASIAAAVHDSTAVPNNPARQQQPGSCFSVVCLFITVLVLTAYTAWSVCSVLVTVLQTRGCATVLQWI